MFTSEQNSNIVHSEDLKLEGLLTVIVPPVVSINVSDTQLILLLKLLFVTEA